MRGFDLGTKPQQWGCRGGAVFCSRTSMPRTSRSSTRQSQFDSPETIQTVVPINSNSIHILKKWTSPFLHFGRSPAPPWVACSGRLSGKANELTIRVRWTWKQGMRAVAAASLPPIMMLSRPSRAPTSPERNLEICVVLLKKVRHRYGSGSLAWGLCRSGGNAGTCTGNMELQF